MSCFPARSPRTTLTGPSGAASWAAAPGPAERALREVQGLLVDTGRDPAVVLAELRSLLAEAGYPTDVLGGIDAGLAADIFGS